MAEQSKAEHSTPKQDTINKEKSVEVSKVAGRLSFYIQEWRNITDNAFVLECIKGYKLKFNRPVGQKITPVMSIPITEENRYREAINLIREKGAIEICTPLRDQFLSPYFLIPKPDGSYRFILNLKSLNEFIDPAHFKMEDLRTARNLVFPDYFMASLDLSDAFHLVPVHKSSRKFLRFKFLDTLYQFTCLPFGLCTSPLIFTKIMKPIMRYIRLRNFSSVIYLDDILCIGSSFEKCKENVDQTISILQSLGFLVNFRKSNINPSKKCKFLGFLIDSEKQTVELTAEKKLNLGKHVNAFIVNSSHTLRDFSQLIGKLVAACPGIDYGWLYLKQLERYKDLSLTHNGFNYEEKITLPIELISDLFWWKNSIEKGKSSFKDGDFQKIIFTDASDSGWGATDDINNTHGCWEQYQKRWHINYKELFVVKIALEFLANDLQNSRILLRIDNTTAVAYINKMGGTRFPKLNALAREIWQWAESRNNFLCASYIPSKENCKADALSRLSNDDTEWELSDSAFSKIEHTFGNMDIDLFATRSNKKCDLYCSRFPDPGAVQIDAFTFNWARLKFYAFPPFAVIIKVLKKIKLEKSSGIVVVPNWPNQPWFPLFYELLTEEPLFLKPNRFLLLSPCRRKIHPRAENLELIVGRLSPRLSGRKEHLARQWRS